MSDFNDFYGNGPVRRRLAVYFNRDGNDYRPRGRRIAENIHHFCRLNLIAPDTDNVKAFNAFVRLVEAGLDALNVTEGEGIKDPVLRRLVEQGKITMDDIEGAE